MSAFIVKSWITNREITLFTHKAVSNNFVVLFSIAEEMLATLYSMLTEKIARPELYWYSLCRQLKDETSKIDSRFPVNLRMKKNGLTTTNELLNIRVHLQNTRLSKQDWRNISQILSFRCRVSSAEPFRIHVCTEIVIVRYDDDLAMCFLSLRRT